MAFTVTSIDAAPSELEAQVPFRFSLLRSVEGPDRPDYWLARLESPLQWNDGARQRTATHIVVSPRHAGVELSRVTPKVVLGLALVTDETALTDPRLDLAKCRYYAIIEARNEGNAV